MFMEIAITAIGIGIVIMVGYLVVAQVRTALPTIYTGNPCYGLMTGNSTTTPDACDGTSALNATYYPLNGTAQIASTEVSSGMDSTATTVYAGFGLIAVGIIVLAAFGLIRIFQ